MKLVKSLLLGSAAGLSAVAVAQAADLPVRKAAPVEYVRVCSAYGAGFFYIPGTDTCLRVGGRARFEYEYDAGHRSVSADQSGYRGLGRLNLDARTQTPYGTLRAFVRFEISKRTGGGVLRSGTAERLGTAIAGLGLDNYTRSQTQVAVDKAFIQFAGFTAGRAASFFDFYAHDLEIQGQSSGSDTASTQLLAYTATFGSGWSATISMEDPTERRTPYFNTANIGSVLGLGTVSGPGITPIGATFDPVTGLPTSFQNLDVAQRNKLPDFVAAIRVDQAWGSAQISGAIHELSFGTFNGTGGTIALATGVATTGAFPNSAIRPDTEYGYAIQGGLKVNLPMIAAGDVLWLQAAYGEGANSYSGLTPGYQGQDLSLGNVTSRFVYNLNDAAIDAQGNVHKTQSVSAVAAFLHYWTPEWRSAFTASYARAEFDAILRTGFGVPGLAPFAAASAPGSSVGARTLAGLNSTFKDYDFYTASANLIWSPVKDLDIGVEVQYVRAEMDGRTLDLNKPFSVNAAGVVLPGVATAASINAGFVPKTVSDDDKFLTRIRVQRDF